MDNAAYEMKFRFFNRLLPSPQPPPTGRGASSLNCKQPLATLYKNTVSIKPFALEIHNAPAKREKGFGKRV